MIDPTNALFIMILAALFIMILAIILISIVDKRKKEICPTPKHKWIPEYMESQGITDNEVINRIVRKFTNESNDAPMGLPSAPPPRILGKPAGLTLHEAIRASRDMEIMMRGITFEQWLDEQMIGITSPRYNEEDIVKR